MSLVNGAREEYRIVDRNAQRQTYLEKARLEDPLFDLIGWYMRHLEE